MSDFLRVGAASGTEGYVAPPIPPGAPAVNPDAASKIWNVFCRAGNATIQAAPGIAYIVGGVALQAFNASYYIAAAVFEVAAPVVVKASEVAYAKWAAMKNDAAASPNAPTQGTELLRTQNGLAQTIAREFQDPATQDLLVDAVTLSCGHNTDLNTARELSNRAQASSRCSTCPGCRNPFLNYAANPAIRNVIQAIQPYLTPEAGQPVSPQAPAAPPRATTSTSARVAQSQLPNPPALPVRNSHRNSSQGHPQSVPTRHAGVPTNDLFFQNTRAWEAAQAPRPLPTNNEGIIASGVAATVNWMWGIFGKPGAR